MIFIEDENLTVGSTTQSVGFTADKIDQTGGTRANKALIYVSGGPVALSYLTDPPTATKSIQYPEGSIIEIDGYDNLVQAKFILLEAGSTNLYCTYGY